MIILMMTIIVIIIAPMVLMLMAMMLMTMTLLLPMKRPINYNLALQMRVLKLAQSWTTMKVLLSIIISTLGALGNLTFILLIVIYIFAILGMQV